MIGWDSAGGPVEISAAVLALDEERFLPLCLKSLKRQTFRGPYEVIVVDNNSRDRAADVAREMEVWVEFEPHRGVTWARQKVLEASRGEVLASVDTGTRVLPDWLERLWDILNRDSRAAVSGGSFSKGRTWRGNLHRWSNALSLFGDKALRLVCGKTGSLWEEKFAVCKDTLIKAGTFNKNIQFYGDDTELSLRLRKVAGLSSRKRSWSNRLPAASRGGIRSGRPG